MWVIGTTNPADHATIIAAESLLFGSVRSPRFATVEHSRADTGCVLLVTHLRRKVPGCEDSH